MENSREHPREYSIKHSRGYSKAVQIFFKSSLESIPGCSIKRFVEHSRKYS